MLAVVLACYLVLAVVEFADALSACRGVFVYRRHTWLKAGVLCGFIVAGIAWPAVAAVWLYYLVRRVGRKNVSDSR